jgi:outer membrane receptor for ferrienterochelin and colicins
MKQFIFMLMILPSVVFTQEKLSGKVLDNADGELPLPGANVYWLNTSVGAVTNFEGEFTLPYKPEYKKLIISFVGYKTDTLTVNAPKYISHQLKATSNLDEVTLEARKKSSSLSYVTTQNVTFVSSDELLKAACCNLSESFETNPSIDVNFADAVSGTKQIKMLGLTSPYILIATENIPTVRGASQSYGMSFIPGTWVESIQITKGAGSVVNGYESIAGQINAELVKPKTDDALFVNVFAAASERVELNTHINSNLNEKWSTGLYLHGNIHQQKHDRNDDGFLDMPLYKQYNIMNRWQYLDSEKGWIGFLNFNYLQDEKQSGQLNFNPETDKLTTNFWGSEIFTNRFQASSKIGYVDPEIPWRSIGFQNAFSHHKQESYYGLNVYNITQNSWYSNLIYNSIISDSRHKIKTGLNYTFDNYSEDAINTRFNRSEYDIGAFFEYAFDNLEALTLTAGLRVDYNNLLGTFVTPRFHARYTPWEKSALRFSFGRGKRSANIFAENQNIFSTNRTISVESSGGNIYGLDPEIAWNYGVSFLQGFNLFNRKGDVAIDFYKTDFTNQVVVDYENPLAVQFYNLEGKSVANSFQLETSYNPFTHFNLKLAYKNYKVTTDYKSGNFQKPLTPEHRFFANMSYEFHSEKNAAAPWKFDATYNWLGEQRFSNTKTNPVAFQLDEYSKSVGTLNVQLTKVFSSTFEVYAGGENITNVRQDNPILGAENPFGTYFDTGFVYGPIFGSNYYAGLRYKIPSKAYKTKL